MAHRRKSRKLGDEERSALENAAAQADAKFSRRFSAEPAVKPSPEPAVSESVAEVVVQRGGLAELKIVYWNGSSPLQAELYTRRADRANTPWRVSGFENGPVRFTPLTVLGASKGWATDEAARLVRCQVLNADLEAPWSVRIKVREG